jgi:hypothetical protein
VIRVAGEFWKVLNKILNKISKYNYIKNKKTKPKIEKKWK